MHDFATACEGHESYHKPSKSAGGKQPLTKDDIQRLKAKVEAARAAERKLHGKD